MTIMKMSCRRTVCVLIWVFCFSRVLKGNLRHVYSVQELKVTGADLKDCENQKLCVTSSSDCLLSLADLQPAPENLLNVSCHILLHKDSLTCRWTQIRGGTHSSFIFSRAEDIFSCSSILNEFSSFFLIIKTKDHLSQEQFSDVFPVLVKDIVQAPRPFITSVDVNDTSVTVSWSSEVQATKCRIRYKLLHDESWTETAGFSVFVIRGLQVFSEYHLSVSCFLGFGRWSDWSVETLVKTAERPPSVSPSLSYYVSSDVNSGGRQLVLLWKALDVREARGLIGGYEVSYMPTKQPSLKKTFNTTDLKAVLLVLLEEYEVSVSAFNSAGRSPDSRLTVDTSQAHGVCALRSLWVYSDGSSLRVRWDGESSSVNLSAFAIQFSEASDPKHTHWRRVGGSTFSSALTGVENQQVYNISVFPVCECVCRSPSSISADLQHGALLDVQQFAVVSVSSSSVSLHWSWQETHSSSNVLQYRLVLSGPQETRTVAVFPDQQQHSFLNLQPNTQYSVYIHGETTAANFTKASLDVYTPLLDYDEMLPWAVPLLLLLLVCGIFSVFTRSICRQYLFPTVSSPRFSLIGEWLLNPHQQAEAEVCVLKLDSVFLMEQQIEKSIVQLESLLSDHQDLGSSPDEGTALWRLSPDTHTPSSLPEYIHLPTIPEHIPYVQNEQIPAV